MRNNISIKTNLVLGVLFIVGNFFVFFILPLLARSNPWFLLLLVPVILTSNTQWALLHEAIHNLYHNNQYVNLYFGRLMSLGFGTQFHLTRFGHLMHHRFNRTNIELNESYDPITSSKWLTSFRYYAQICVGLYLSEIIIPILFFMPKQIIMKVEKKILGDNSPYYKSMENILKAKTLAQIRLDTLCMLFIWITSFHLYGELWLALIIATLVRGFLVSFADNLPHYGTQINDVTYAYNLSLPWILQKFILNFNLHRIHHQYPYIPWVSLPSKFVALGEKCDHNYFRQGMRQWRGLIPIEILKLKSAGSNNNSPSSIRMKVAHRYSRPTNNLIGGGNNSQ